MGRASFMFLAELSGTSGYRTAFGVSQTPTSPACITSVLGTTAMERGGVAEKGGYNFLVYLPTAAVPAMPDPGKPTNGVPQDANRQEVAFACYAWPVETGVTGRRAFVVSAAGARSSPPTTTASRTTRVWSTAHPPVRPTSRPPRNKRQTWKASSSPEPAPTTASSGTPPTPAEGGTYLDFLTCSKSQR